MWLILNPGTLEFNLWVGSEHIECVRLKAVHRFQFCSQYGAARRTPEGEAAPVRSCGRYDDKLYARGTGRCRLVCFSLSVWRTLSLNACDRVMYLLCKAKISLIRGRWWCPNRGVLYCDVYTFWLQWWGSSKHARSKFTRMLNLEAQGTEPIPGERYSLVLTKKWFVWPNRREVGRAGGREARRWYRPFASTI